ncbi:glycosyl transferase family protein [Candidatus Magnetoovum chiemensis]|nr:glycosyl transferase family protein [Candidatus Magnetoovum chiemensis]
MLIKKTGSAHNDILIVVFFIIINALLLFNGLGDMNAPTTYWKPLSKGEAVYIDIGNYLNIEKACFFGGIGSGQYRLEISSDRKEWEFAVVLTQRYVFEWNCVKIDLPGRFISLIVQTEQAMLNELAFFSVDNTTPLAIKSFGPLIQALEVSPNVDNLFDEQNLVPDRPSYKNSAYFDEVYFPRTAYEYINKKLPFYETVHPPLGKLIVALGILVFDMNPFGWRVMSALFGVLITAVMYLFGKRIFINNGANAAFLAFICAFLMTFDFMHFAQARIGTTDTFLVTFIVLAFFFMFRFFQKLENTLYSFRDIALSGAFLGLAAAVKWSGVYAGCGLAIFYVYSFFINYKTASKKIKRYTFKSALFGIAFLFVLPLAVYASSYIPAILIEQPNSWIDYIVSYQTHMFNYHKNLKAEHFFSSKWWQWPLLIKPLWLFTAKDYLPADKISSIVTMGNPLIWWSGAISLIYLLISAVFSRDRTALFIAAAILCQYLPWMLIERIAFIYHFYPIVPFLIFSIAYSIGKIIARSGIFKYTAYIYMTAVFILFVLFYPILSGAVADKAYVSNYLRWFNTWYFY